MNILILNEMQNPKKTEIGRNPRQRQMARATFQRTTETFVKEKNKKKCFLIVENVKGPKLD